MASFTISQHGKTFHLTWELLDKDKRRERFKVTPRDNPTLFIILENNWPFIREVKKLKYKPIQWKQVEGPEMSPQTLKDIIKNIESGGREQDHQLPPTPTIPRGRKKKDGPPGKSLGERNQNPE